jgi:type II secretory pathway component PulK
MVIDDNYIAELKALAKITKKEFTQLQQYMKISGIKNGCIINVNTDSVQVLAALLCLPAASERYKPYHAVSWWGVLFRSR